MKLFYQLSLAALAAALVAVPQSAGAQRRDDDVRRSRGEIERDGRWDDRNGDWDWDDDRDDARRRNRDVRPGRRVGQDEAWLRKHQAKREEWCRRHRDDRRCDDLFRRGTGQNWCWDTNRDGRCDNVDNRRRDSRSGVIRDRARDRGPEWDRWLRANGVSIGSTVPIPVPR